MSKAAKICSLLLLLVGCHRQHLPKVEVWTISLRPLFTSYMEDIISRWESKHPGVQVEWVDLPINAIQQKLIAAFGSGQPPSVVNLNTDMAHQLAEAGALTDLGKVISPQVRSNYFQGFWNDDAIPWYVSAQVLLYNADIFQKAGLNPDKPPKTWDELIQAAMTIKNKTNLYGWFPAIKFVEDLQEQGISVVDANGKRALFDQPQAVKRLQMYLDLFQKGYIPRETVLLSKAYPQAVDMYQAGKLGILQTGPQFLSRVRDNAPSIYKVTRVAPLPLGEGNVIAAASMNLVIPKNAPHFKEALDFALFLTNDENQLNFSKIVLIFPSTIRASQSLFFKSSQGDPLMASARYVGAEELKIARDLTLTLKNEKERNKVMEDALESVFLGEKTPEKALHDAALAWDEILK